MKFIDKILYECLLFEKKEKEKKVKRLKLILQKVVSSNVHSIGYDKKSQTLQVKFLGGGVYQYSDVPKNVFKQFTKVKSKGKFVWRRIRDQYDYERV